MLILARTVGKAIIVGDEISVTVLGVNNGEVRIGISAPKQIEVHREEVFRGRQRANAKTTAGDAAL